MNTPTLSYEDDVDPKGLGLVCFRWAHLEYLLAIVIWRVLDVDEEVGAILTGGLDIRPRCHMAKRLAAHHKADSRLLSALQATATFIDKNKDERNIIVHGIYGMNPETAEVFVTMHRGKTSTQRMTNKRISAFLLKMNSVTVRLEQVLLQLRWIDDGTLTPDT